MPISKRPDTYLELRYLTSSVTIGQCGSGFLNVHQHDVRRLRGERLSGSAA